MSGVKIGQAIETVEDLFKRFNLPPHISRMTYHEAAEIGIPREVVEYLELDSQGEYSDIDRRDQFLMVAMLTRLCTLEDQIERGELKQVSEIEAYLQRRMSEWDALGDRKYDPANMWGYNFIRACQDDLEAWKNGGEIR